MKNDLMGDGEDAGSRRTRTELLVGLAVVGVAVAVAAVARWGSEPTLDDLPGMATPWLPGEGPTRRISGRVVSPGGDPIAGVGVQLVYPGDPHWGETVAYETTSDAEGRFGFDGIANRVQFQIVVNGRQARWTFEPPHDPDAAELRVGDIRLAPDYPVRIVVRCTSAPRPTRPARPNESEPPSVELRWLPGAERYAMLFPSAEDAPPDRRSVESPVLPGRQIHLPPVRRSARRFIHETRLPAGRFLATVYGPCGVAQREVEIQPSEAGAQVVELVSPVPEHGSLSIDVAPSEGTPGADHNVYVHLKLGPVALGGPATRPGQTSQVWGLSPGTYDVSVSGHDCPVQIPPRGAVRLRFGPNGCEVTQESEANTPPEPAPSEPAPGTGSSSAALD